MTTSPNILLIMADQLAPHFTGAYGHPTVKTPNIDALASLGTRFDTAYCNSPLCAPSRSAFMTGQLVSRTTVYDNAAELRASVPTFAHYLTRLGYRTCLSGRMHFVGPDQKHGFQDRVTTDVYPADFAWTPDWENHAERIDSWYHNMQPVKESGVAQATFQMDFDDEAAFAARRWLFEYARDKAQGQAAPFALVASFMHPHDPYVARPEWWDLYADEEIDPPDFVPKQEEQDAHSRRILDGIGADAVDVTDDDIQRSRRAYFANVSYIDDKVGQLVRALNEIGEMDNTIVIFTSDHGDMLGERGLWYKMTFFEHSARVPLIIAGPGIAQGTAANACSLVDILPTLLEIGGGDDAMLGATIDGRSLMPLARGEADPVDEAVGEYCGEMAPYPIFLNRLGRSNTCIAGLTRLNSTTWYPIRRSGPTWRMIPLTLIMWRHSKQRLQSVGTVKDYVRMSLPTRNRVGPCTRPGKPVVSSTGTTIHPATRTRNMSAITSIGQSPMPATGSRRWISSPRITPGLQFSLLLIR